jgi:hypothetical protein
MALEQRTNYCSKKGKCTAASKKTDIICRFFLRACHGHCSYLAWEDSCMSLFAIAAAKEDNK